MSRGQWTLMQWSTNSFKYIPRRLGAPRLPLSTRQRIPSIDKLTRSDPDPRPRLFLELVSVSTPNASAQLDNWCEDLDIDVLEEFAHALVTRGSPGQSSALNVIPERAMTRLSEYGLAARVLQPEQYGIQYQNDSHCDQPRIHQEGLAIDEQIAATLTPLEILREYRSKDPAVLQRLLDSATMISPEIKQLQEDWLTQLRSQQDMFALSDRQLDIIQYHLTWVEQCEVVAKFLAEFTAKNVHSQFPQSLAGICLKLGRRLEHRMLEAVARANGILVFHPQSEFLWGLLQSSPWTVKQHICLGAAWLQVAIAACKFQQVVGKQKLSRPAFWKTWYVNKTQRRGVLVVNGFLLNQIRAIVNKKKQDPLYINPQNLPLLVKPRPWTSTSEANSPSPRLGMSLIASPSTEGIATVRESLKSGAALPQLRGLNRLQEQSWRVNRQVLEVLQSFPDQHREAALAIADALGDRAFYLPMYMDFRGRCYTSAKVLLNFMNDDSIRSLFLFAEPRRLGASGLRWLCIHLANMAGHCKSQSYDDRLRWVESHRDAIVESAMNPLAQQWWRTDTDKPFQTLAACMEVAAAWKCKDPTEFLSALPVQLDGTSNGLQHLVALARDETNAPLVNLRSQPHAENGVAECGDIYSAVARSIAANAEALSPEINKITRKDVKHAVMTYFYGASEQTIRTLLSDVTPESTSSEVTQSPKIVQLFNATMTKMFQREREIQNWLTDCAKRIMSCRIASQSFTGTSLVWTSSLGLPVVHPYVETQNFAIRTPLQSFWLPSPYHLQAVDRRKQVASVNANFIHSLDAAHMLLTASMIPAELSFAAIHDSFWTYAGSVDVMNRVLRQAFVEIHRGSPLEDLRNEWLARYSDFVVLATVYSDSPLYEKLVWQRSGVTGGERQQKALRHELVQHYQEQHDVAYQTVAQHQIKWENSKPFLGTPGLPFVRMWVPLQLAAPPEKGSLDINEVLQAEYFFN